jgi:hypothetical protein
MLCKWREDIWTLKSPPSAWSIIQSIQLINIVLTMMETLELMDCISSENISFFLDQGLVRMGSPSPTHVSESQHGGKVPTFEARFTKIWWIIMKVQSSSFYANVFVCWELGLAFCSTHLSTQVSSLTSKKCTCCPCRHPCLTGDLGLMWSG